MSATDSQRCEICRKPATRICDECPASEPDRYTCDATACRRAHAARSTNH